ncbi:hypothetical protein SAMN06265360_10569 [Haloechinothrix alba]|uniref:Uncharacterized protein n=2 Tax=Haloechinothrix alba TaxID=664784 RepID=A0A238W3F8_9PSEU|nr:hypothetical protein SAMN06265360_10569 [Haloechinothrix alba]
MGMRERKNIARVIELEVEKMRETWAVTPERDRVPPAFFRKYIEGLTEAADIVRNNGYRPEEHFDESMSSNLSTSPRSRDISGV